MKKSFSVDTMKNFCPENSSAASRNKYSAKYIAFIHQNPPIPYIDVIANRPYALDEPKEDGFDTVVVREVVHLQQCRFNVQSRQQLPDRPDLVEPVPSDLLGRLGDVRPNHLLH